MAPLTFVRTPDAGTDPWNRVVKSTGGCRAAGKQGGAVPFLVALAVINGVSVVFANAQAYRARHIHTEFSESRYIGLIMLFLLQSWLTGIPVIGLVYDQPKPYYVVVASMVSFTSLVTILLMFVPKMQHTVQWKKEQEEAKSRARQVRGSSFLNNMNNRPPSSTNADSSADGLQVYRGRETVKMFHNKSDMISSSLRNSSSLKHGSNHLYSLGTANDVKDYMERSNRHSPPRRDQCASSENKVPGDVEERGTNH